MGAILKFIIFLLGIFFLLSMLLGASTMRLIVRLIFRGRKKSQQNQSAQEPITQSDRIISYKKKEFETSAAEDVEFEEIKENDK
ncbi:MAG: hypothetical protein PHO84_07915 [Dysgonamonadaceae bacterium]|jgi:predicted lipid-binding transport protein (Tim44 family)|nr:hypothetical protein [Dysgonamonadaceae bacterium]MDD3356716.1 hypothetical protein [Dysgonamonadaceae bacterium]MDD3728035.1 hypothetical protein [Dysgonamonadaceae bacterium]MDD4247062.1 hypothetical protein [Dysgonamonadaceae bacterium]MDD4606264.1 hypothetical protein [Dysgonamonadaceae bacterium]